jgi:hypothetical protein
VVLRNHGSVPFLKMLVQTWVTQIFTDFFDSTFSNVPKKTLLPNTRLDFSEKVL